MKYSYLFLFYFLIFTSCKKDIKIFENQKKIANTVLNNWHKAAAEANYKSYFDAMDTEAVFIGTDASENWTKPAFQKFSKPYFDKGKAWSFKVLERNMYLNKKTNFIWFDELLNTQMGICRGSGVLEKINDTWKIKHYVLSIAIPNEDVKAVINIKKEKDSLFLQKISTKINQ